MNHITRCILSLYSFGDDPDNISGEAFIEKSVSIIADSINNLSDMGSSVVTLIGFKMANKPADEDHPYGHERIEYIDSIDRTNFSTQGFSTNLFENKLTKVKYKKRRIFEIL